MLPCEIKHDVIFAGAEAGLDLSPAGLERAAERMLAMPQVDMPLRHHFVAGVCVRELTIPAGTLVLGHYHRFAEINIMLTGWLTLLNEDGTTTDLRAPQTFVAQPGQKIAYIHEDVVWQNVWPWRNAGLNGETVDDVEALENYYLDQSPALARSMDHALALARLARSADRDSFAAFLREHDLPAELVRQISEIQDDIIPLPPGSWGVRVGDSAIEGKGLLATSPFRKGEVIGPARIGGKCTPIGRYTNHSGNPNAEMGACLYGSKDGFELLLMATRDIAGAQGGQPGEEITVNYSQVLNTNKTLAEALANWKGS